MADDRDATVSAVLARLPEELLGAIPDVLSVHDAEGRYLYVSQALEPLTGHPVDEILGESPFDLGLIHRDDLDGVVDVQTRALASGEPWRIQFRLRRRDDAYVWVESAGAVVPVDGSALFVVLTREASQVESLLQGIAFERSLNQQLDELLARQRRFLTTVSHSARTPLTAITGMLELLHVHGRALDEERRDQLFERLRANSSRLTALLEEVTDADRLARADVVLERRLVRLREVADGAIEGLTGPDGGIDNTIDPDLLAVVDRDRVGRLLAILVGNALHHGGIGTTVVLRGRSTDDGGLELIVEDDGPGIPPEDRPEIFKPFSHGAPDHPDPGAGLGLYVVAELAALHGGRVWVDDRPGGGARFHVVLPRARVDHAAVPDAPADRVSGSALRPDAQAVVERTLQTLRRRVGLDVVYLSILDDQHQHVLATAGTALAGIEAGRRIPLADAYCARMVAGELEQVIADTAGHAVVGDLPATSDGLACYVGVPVHLPSGKVFGSLCAASGDAHPELAASIADEFATFADILGDQLASEGFIDGTAMDAASRVADVLTRHDVLTMAFQPIVDLRDGRLAGIEALARFSGFDRPVGLWFADAARAGLLVDLEVRSVELALTGLDLVGDDAYLAINVSPRTVRSRELATALADAPLHRLVLEVTEHAAIDDYEPLLDALTPLRQDGLRVALDDMGTGYAGLGHLLQLRPDIMKIDRALVDTLHDDPPHRASVAGIVRLADHLSAAVVAEGVEAPATLRAVGDLGFTHAQGYLLGRPEPTVDPKIVTATARQHLDALPSQALAQQPPATQA